MRNISSEKAAPAEVIFREHGGLLRTSEALDPGVHSHTFYYLRDTDRQDAGARAASGAYFVRLRIGTAQTARQVTLVR